MICERAFMYLATSTRPECHASTIVELPSGDLYGAWYAGTYEGHPDVAVLASRLSVRSGKWEPAIVLANTPGQPEGNPVLFMSPDRGRLFLFFVTIRCDGWRGAQLRAMWTPHEGLIWSQPYDFDQEPLGTMPRNKPILIGERVLLPLYDETTWRGFVY
ncbi:MAG: exo-alpha-sialidase, partial [Armatimonadetes bacterium]|nr:exo-alpha-sialidase [Armatimonadota bacterium]